MVVKTFIKSKTNGVQLLQAYFKDYRIVVQYFFAILLAKYYSVKKKFSVVNKYSFMLCYKEYYNSRKQTTPTKEKKQHLWKLQNLLIDQQIIRTELILLTILDKNLSIRNLILLFQKCNNSKDHRLIF